jgi:hypothetical protein
MEYNQTNSCDSKYWFDTDFLPHLNLKIPHTLFEKSFYLDNYFDVRFTQNSLQSKLFSKSFTYYDLLDIINYGNQFICINKHYFLAKDDNNRIKNETNMINEALTDLSNKILQKYHLDNINTTYSNFSNFSTNNPNNASIYFNNKTNTNNSSYSKSYYHNNPHRHGRMAYTHLTPSYIPTSAITHTQLVTSYQTPSKNPTDSSNFNLSSPPLSQASNSSFPLKFSIPSPIISNLQPFWQSIQDFDLELLGKFQIKTFKKMFGYQKSISHLFSQIIHLVISNSFHKNPNNYNSNIFDLYLKLKLLFFPMILHIDHTPNSIKKRIKLFQTFDWQILLDDFLECISC